jgi:hypothetical protein
MSASLGSDVSQLLPGNVFESGTLSTDTGLGRGVLSGTDGDPDPPQEDRIKVKSSVQNIFILDFLTTSNQIMCYWLIHYINALCSGRS